MDKKTVNIIAYSIILGMSCWIFSLTADLQLMNSKMLPLVVNSLMAGLAGVGIVAELCSKKKETKKEPQKTKSNMMFLWLLPLAGLALGCRLLGFYAAPFLFVVLYIRLNGGSVKETIICALSTPALIYLLFNVLLTLDLERGILVDILFQ